MHTGSVIRTRFSRVQASGAMSATACLALLAVLAGCGSGPGTASSPESAQTLASVPDDGPRDAPAARDTRRRGAAPHVVVAVGDIACAPGERRTSRRCRQGDTAALAASLSPDTVLGLGDLQYEQGTRRAFRRSYHPSWGALKSITRPVPGNHEYYTAGASGYYRYFSRRQPGSPGYYARRLGPWTAYAVNSNCTKIDCDQQEQWLRTALDGDTRCSLLFMHHPRFSSGEHGSQRSMSRFFSIAYDRGVDVVLSGHDHHYERFVPKNAAGDSRPDTGVVQYVSGGGGKSHYAAQRDVPGSAFIEDDTFGVLRLALGADGWTSSFRGIDGSNQDTYTGTCH